MSDYDQNKTLDMKIQHLLDVRNITSAGQEPGSRKVTHSSGTPDKRVVSSGSSWDFHVLTVGITFSLCVISKSACVAICSIFDHNLCDCYLVISNLCDC